MASHNHEDFETCTSSYSTPKLSLSKLPNKPIRNNNHHLAAYTTPPLHPLVSIPFQWEEAPGKPKSPTKSKVARCLDLPPRLLLSEAMKITNTPSPTTVLDGPYVGRSFSSINEAALEKKEISGNNKEISGNNKDMLMRSCRWESFKENNRGVVVKGSFDFSGPLSSNTSSAYDFDIHQRKVLRFTRKGSFFSFSRNNSNLLGGIYDSIKQAVPWRWRRAKSKRAL